MNRYQRELSRITLPEETRQALLRLSLPRRRWPAAALIAAVLCLLTATVCFAAWQGWLSPMVDYSGNEALVEGYDVAVGQTVAGAHCDLTLERAVTDGIAVYASFTARCGESFPDPDDILEWSGVTAWRTDGGEEPGVFRFLCAEYPADQEDLCADSLLGQPYRFRIDFLDDGGTGRMEVIESYRFDGITLNETIPSVDALWTDGTQLHVTPLGLRLTCSDRDPALLDGDGLLNSAAWDDKYRDRSPVLQLTDGTEVPAEELGLRHACQGASHPSLLGGWSGGQSAGAVRCTYSLFFAAVRDPQTVAAVLVNSQRYALSDAVRLTVTTNPSSGS